MLASMTTMGLSNVTRIPLPESSNRDETMTGAAAITCRMIGDADLMYNSGRTSSCDWYFGVVYAGVKYIKYTCTSPEFAILGVVHEYTAREGLNVASEE